MLYLTKQSVQQMLIYFLVSWADPAGSVRYIIPPGIYQQFQIKYPCSNQIYGFHRLVIRLQGENMIALIFLGFSIKRMNTLSTHIYIYIYVHKNAHCVLALLKSMVNSHQEGPVMQSLTVFFAVNLNKQLKTVKFLLSWDAVMLMWCNCNLHTGGHHRV